MGYNLVTVCEMRKHLLRSLEEKVLSMFPVEKMKRGRVCVHCINSIEIFCSCRMPIEGKMIQCSGCKESYHMACVMDVLEKAVDELDYVWFYTYGTECGNLIILHLKSI